MSFSESALRKREREPDRAEVAHALTGVQAGRCEGRKPYGDREGELEVIRQMRRMRSEGAGYQTIAAKLNEQGIPPVIAVFKMAPQLAYWTLLRVGLCFAKN